MSCQADDLLNANHLILTNHSAYQLIFIIQAYLLCVLLYSTLGYPITMQEMIFSPSFKGTIIMISNFYSL